MTNRYYVRAVNNGTRFTVRNAYSEELMASYRHRANAENFARLLGDLVEGPDPIPWPEEVRSADIDYPEEPEDL